MLWTPTTVLQRGRGVLSFVSKVLALYFIGILGWGMGLVGEWGGGGGAVVAIHCC